MNAAILRLSMTRRHGGYRQDEDFQASDRTRSFSQEPHFQSFVLRNRVPLIADGTVYDPLCTEFPSSPGVDLTYVTHDLRFLLAEFKYESYSVTKMIEEIARQWTERISAMAIEDILRYVDARPEESNRDVASEVAERLRAEGSRPLRALYEEDRIALACVVYGEPKLADLDEGHQYADIYGLEVSEDAQHVVQYRYLNALGDRRKRDAQILAGARNDRSVLEASRVQRPSHSRESVLATARECEGTETWAKVTMEFCRAGFILKPGQGEQLSLQLQFVDRTGRRRCLLAVEGDKSLLVPSNLFYQLNYLGITEEELTAFLDETIAVFPEGEARYVGRGSVRITMPIEVSSDTDRRTADLLGHLMRFVVTVGGSLSDRVSPHTKT